MGSLGVTDSACSPCSEGMAERKEADDHKITKPAVAAVPLPANRAWLCQWGKTQATRSYRRRHSIITMTITLLQSGMLQQQEHQRLLDPAYQAHAAVAVLAANQKDLLLAEQAPAQQQHHQLPLLVAPAVLRHREGSEKSLPATTHHCCPYHAAAVLAPDGAAGAGLSARRVCCPWPACQTGRGSQRGCCPCRGSGGTPAPTRRRPAGWPAGQKRCSKKTSTTEMSEAADHRQTSILQQHTRWLRSQQTRSGRARLIDGTRHPNISGVVGMVSKLARLPLAMRLPARHLPITPTRHPRTSTTWPAPPQQ